MKLFAAFAAMVLLSATEANAWVAVRAPVMRGAAVGVAAGAVAGAAVANSNSYHSTTVVAAPPAGVVTTLPSGCASSGGVYHCGSSTYQPYFGSNGVYYQPVP